MKIGEFSKKYNLSPDTIRYYIQLGLIFPKKVGKQNIFSLDNEFEF
ncbi:MAG: MerR family DNA-binding transcriptional regulator [Psychrilyobacter sp.]|nr:MerR family DNA-binding transcriptional regulator [Psychrilyobacter sp.]